MTDTPDATAEPLGPPRWRRPLVISGIVAFVLFLIVALLVVIALTFSVQVNGHSMEPTLHTGDRLFTNFLAKDDVDRFDLVQGKLGPYRQEVVKRVVGLPGDRISIEGGPKPVVYLQPKGQAQKYRVESTTWASQIGDRIQACCNADGTRIDSGKAKTITIPDGEYWVVGDNWGGSDDSRTYGFLHKKDVQSILAFRVLPIGKLGSIPNPAKLVPVAGS